MKTSILVSIFIFVFTPILLSLIISIKKNNKTNQLTFPKWSKIILVLVFFLVSGITVMCFIQNIFADPAWPAYFPFWCMLNLTVLFGVLWILTYKIIVLDNCFICSSIFRKKKTYQYHEITGIKWLRGSEVFTTFKIRIGKKKIEVSNLMINFDLLYKKLAQEKIFRKYPRPIKGNKK